MCKKIHRGGNAEQYHADKKYKEAVAVAVEKCADDTKGQKCYICLEAVHPHTGEGLVRGCACGDREGVKSPELGVAHVTCLARQAKILREEAEEDNLDEKGWKRWHTCGLCEQRYHGVVCCALGWACWKTYLGRPEGDGVRRNAMNMLENGLGEAGRHEEELNVLQAKFANESRLGALETTTIITKSNMATCYGKLGRHEEALAIRREVYARLLARGMGPSTGESFFQVALNLSCSLKATGRAEEAKSFLRKQMPNARRALDAESATLFQLRWVLATCLCMDDTASQQDVVEAITIYEELDTQGRRVYGPAHPLTADIQKELRAARKLLRLY